MSHIPYPNHYHLPRLREMGRVYWIHSFGALGISLAAIFVPIYLLNSGVSFRSVLLFALAQFGIAGLLQYPAVGLLRYISPHHVLAIGQFLMSLFYVLLATVDINLYSLAVLALVWGIQHAIYWPTFHYVFGVARAHDHGNRQVAGLDALVITAASAAPAIGGIIATQVGINYTYAFSIALFFIAIIPMLDKNYGPEKVKLQTSWNQLKEIRRDLFANICHGSVNTIENLIWPLFVFLIVSSYAGVGILSSVIAFSSMVITLYVGRRSERKGEKPYINQGIFTLSLTNVGRAAVQNAGHVFGLNLLAGIGKSLYHAPFLSRYYKNSDNASRLGYITAMETFHSLGYVFLTAILILISFFVSAKIVLSIGLGVAAFTILGLRLMR